MLLLKNNMPRDKFIYIVSCQLTDKSPFPFSCHPKLYLYKFNCNINSNAPNPSKKSDKYIRIGKRDIKSNI